MATETGLKHTLFNLFGASKHPTQGHVWEKINKFRNPTEFSQLKNHPLYGIKGWALALLIWLVVSAAFGVFMTHAFGYSLKLMNSRAFAQLEDHYTFELVAAWFVLGWSCVTAYLLWTKDEEFHMSFFYQLVTVIVLQIITRLSYDDTDVRATGVVRAFMLLIIFVPLLWYSFRSKRIAVTCAGMLRHDDPFLATLKKRESKPNTKSTPNSKGKAPTSTVKQSPPSPVEEEDIYQNSENGLDDSDLEFYEQVWKELEHDQTDKGIWAKAFTGCDGDYERTKASYIRMRVSELKAEQQARIDQHEREREREREQEKHKKLLETLEKTKRKNAEIFKNAEQQRKQEQQEKQRVAETTRWSPNPFIIWFTCVLSIVFVIVVSITQFKPQSSTSIKYSDGAEYVGEVKGGKRHGQGTYTDADGFKYVGEWKYGEPWNGFTSKKGSIIAEFKEGVSTRRSSASTSISNQNFETAGLQQIFISSDMGHRWVCSWKKHECACPHLVKVTNSLKNTTVTSITVEVYENTFGYKTRIRNETFIGANLTFTDHILPGHTRRLILYPPNQWCQAGKANPSATIYPKWRLIGYEGY
jgi:hypothetical protein